MLQQTPQSKLSYLTQYTDLKRQGEGQTDGSALHLGLSIPELPEFLSLYGVATAMCVAKVTSCIGPLSKHLPGSVVKPICASPPPLGDRGRILWALYKGIKALACSTGRRAVDSESWGWQHDHVSMQLHGLEKLQLTRQHGLRLGG